MTDRRRRMKARGMTDVLTNLFPPPPWTSAALRLNRGGSSRRCDGAPVWSGGTTRATSPTRGCRPLGRASPWENMAKWTLALGKCGRFVCSTSVIFQIVALPQKLLAKNVRSSMGKASVVSSGIYWRTAVITQREKTRREKIMNSFKHIFLLQVTSQDHIIKVIQVLIPSENKCFVS